MISWILKKIAIGEYTDAVNTEALIQGKIDCVLSLRGGEAEDSSIVEESVCHSLRIAFFRVPIYDLDYWANHESHKGQTNVKIQCKTAVYMLELLAEKYNRILVHCTAGIDRAPFIVALYMANIELAHQGDYAFQNNDLKHWMSEAYKVIKEHRPQIIKHLEWI